MDIPGFQEDLVEYLRNDEAGLWKVFSSKESLKALEETTRLELLKATVRLSPASHPRPYDAAREAARILDVQAQIIIYQGPDQNGANASLFFTEDVAHVVLFGPILDRLDDAELRALMGHELAHHKLWTMDGGKFWVADRLLDSNASHPGADDAHVITAERFRLYTELVADRGSALAAGGNDPAISLLLKVGTGLSDPDVSAYREQVEDVMKDGLLASDGGTHPEPFIRVKSLDAWSNGEEDTIDAMIRGPLHLERLDVLGQKHLEELTKKFLSVALEPEWIRTEAVLGQVRLLFSEFSESGVASPKKGTLAEIIAAGEQLHDYWCYLLLDLAAADRDLDEMGVLRGLLVAEELDCREKFQSIASKELRMTKRRLSELWGAREKLLAAASKPTAKVEAPSALSVDGVSS